MNGSDHKAWLACFKLGPGLDKKDATHKDALNSWFQVPAEKLKEMRDRTVEAYFYNQPLTVSEKAHLGARAFLDIDSNKKEGDPLIADRDMLEWTAALSAAISRDWRLGRISQLASTTAAFMASQLIGNGDFGWLAPDSPLDDDSDDEGDAPGAGAAAARARRIQRIIDDKLEPAVAFVLGSPSPRDRNLATYHIIFPLLAFRYPTAWLRYITAKLKDESWQRQLMPAARAVTDYVDAQVCSNGLLRGYLCEKDPGDRRAFALRGIVEPTGPRDLQAQRADSIYREIVIRGPDLDQLKLIWNATSLLVTAPAAVAAAEPRPSGHAPGDGGDHPGDAPEPPEPPPPKPRWALAHYSYDPVKVRGLIEDIYERHGLDETSGDFLEEVKTAIAQEFNHFVAAIHGTGRPMFVFKQSKCGERFPQMTFRTENDMRMIFEDSAQSISWPPPGQRQAKKHKQLSIVPWDIWRQSAERQVYKAYVIKPRLDEKEDELNIWTPNEVEADLVRGFSGRRTVDPADQTETTIADFLGHVRNTLAAGDERLYTYLINWMAHLVQRPGIRIGTCPIFIGEEGCGKDFVVNTLGAILGKRLYLTVSNLADLSNFNASLEGRALVCFNESSEFSQGALNVLKSLITDESLRLERKFQDAVSVANVGNYIINTNVTTKHLFTDVSSQARRWLMCYCDSSRNRDYAHWRRLWRWMVGDDTMDSTIRSSSPGVAAVADFLYHHVDISAWDPRAEFVGTETLVRNKLAVMNPVHSWWYEGLYTGEIKNSMYRTPIDSSNWATTQLQVPKADLFEHFNDWVRNTGTQGIVTNLSNFAHLLGLVIGKGSSGRLRVMNPTTGATNRIATAIIPPLAEARHRFEQVYTGFSFASLDGGQINFPRAPAATQQGPQVDDDDDVMVM